MGRHFFISQASPFFGISFIIDERKLTVNVPFRNTVLEYLCNGLRNMFQYLVINLVLSPSRPAAEFLFAPSIAESSSPIDRSSSSLAFSSTLSFKEFTSGWFRTSGPRKFSIQLSKFSGSFRSSLKESAK
jgi:hypothetical protein